MIFKGKELKKLNEFIQKVIKEYPIYNQPKYFNRLMKFYKR